MEIPIQTWKKKKPIIHECIYKSHVKMYISYLEIAIQYKPSTRVHIQLLLIIALILRLSISSVDVLFFKNDVST